MDVPRLRIVLGNHPHVQALKQGELRSELFELEFIEYSPTNTAFKPMVREQAFDVCEMAIVTYLMAKAYSKPLVLLPAVMLGRFQNAYAIYNGERGMLRPGDLEGKRVGIRSFTTTTGAWIRGILANDHGVNLDRIHWITFEDPHIAEYRDTTERAPAGKNIIEMLLNGELDAVLGETANDSRLRPLFPDPAAEATRWFARHGVVPVNHLVVVTERLARERPDIVRELYRLLKQSKAVAEKVMAEKSSPAPDTAPFGVEANRNSLELIIRYAAQQLLIPRRFTVDELFDEATRGMN
jgi:4,5-dihydroxyphthalate decarboxylase